MFKNFIKISTVITTIVGIAIGKAITPVVKVCGKSQCDSNMLKRNGNIGGWHVPNLNNLTVTAWANAGVNTGKLITTNLGLTSVVKYGGFCSGSQKTAYFLSSSALTFPNPSWIAQIPAGDLDISGNLKVGFSYKLDVKNGDLAVMNQVATTCQAQCKSMLGCNFAHYGWEQPAGWFCKFYKSTICNVQEMWWKPAPPALPVTTFGGIVTEAVGVIGGCRVTDTISQTTPLLRVGSRAISTTTPYTASLSYLTLASYTRLDGNVASIKCDTTGGALTPGWPTFGTIWI